MEEFNLLKQAIDAAFKAGLFDSKSAEVVINSMKIVEAKLLEPKKP